MWSVLLALIFAVNLIKECALLVESLKELIICKCAHPYVMLSKATALCLFFHVRNICLIGTTLKSQFYALCTRGFKEHRIYMEQFDLTCSL